MMNRFTLLFFISVSVVLNAQNFSRKDSLQGSLRPERTSFNVLRYDLNIKINTDKKIISGYNDIFFEVMENTHRIQLDLFTDMQVDSIVFQRKKLTYTREFNAVFIDFEGSLTKGKQDTLRFYYSGKPLTAKNAPWDGGFVWRKDKAGKPWIGVAVQGTGASLWYPVKDHQSDEPDLGATIKVAVPDGLMNVSNGRLLGSEKLLDGYTRWDWEVKNPINSYNITINVGDYVHFGENYNGLDLDYYVLRENLPAAKVQFEEVKPMMDCFQEKFGIYPFTGDSYKLVDTPYLGMEHQSAVAYGNQYRKGYLGNDLSGTGIGLKFDFIIIHESAHEWFGNSITSSDIADMWIHEGFTTYAESVFVECEWGYDKAMQYINGQSNLVRNDAPVIGEYGVNKKGSGDMYPKGALMINTLRHIVNNDAKWWRILRKYVEIFRHQIINTQTVIDFFNKETGLNLSPVFRQYLYYKNIPILEVEPVENSFRFRWKTDVENFEMTFEFIYNGKKYRQTATNNWQQFSGKVDLVKIDFNSRKFFYKK
ncbi:MAG: peptidase M1 [Flavobacteriales bacterium CG_4_9_14_3_um_filter_40_17]|nr:MAG: peptidase M1 [Flavobacteriales bacterium CG_4_9_14_3_um_filter_40_17]